MTSPLCLSSTAWAILDFSEVQADQLAALSLSAPAADQWRALLGDDCLAERVSSWQEAGLDIKAATLWIQAGLSHYFEDMVPAFEVRGINPARVRALLRVVPDPREVIAWLDALPSARQPAVLRDALDAGLTPAQVQVCATLIAAPQ
jgi:hypothetical protein